MSRKSKKNVGEAISFDENARTEYLTGFRKRNLEKKKKQESKAKTKLKELKKNNRRLKREKSRDLINRHNEYLNQDLDFV